MLHFYLIKLMNHQDSAYADRRRVYGYTCIRLTLDLD